ncbi:2-keto-4-pentenoate hydratase [Allohahella marinimesophila]|uniref:Fumarylacetoacetate hydrolase family protein n=1 Tax=Allohahella marinimesophila TaxID=1054972 RepID=A0ABP7NHD3_9GAMM
MTDDNRIELAAEALVQAHRSRDWLEAEPYPLTNETEAYEVQSIVADELGLRSGWKLGLNAEGRAIHAPLYAERTHPSPAHLKRGAFNRFLLESELAISFGKALPPRPEPYTRADVQAAAGFIHPAFEVVDTRFEAWPDVDALWLLADGMSHGCFVLGKGVPINSPARLTRASYRLTVDDRTVQDAERAHPQPDPWDTLTQLANHLSAHDVGLAEGDVVTTGTFSGVTPLEAGQVAEVCFEGIGCCRITLR